MPKGRPPSEVLRMEREGVRKKRDMVECRADKMKNV